MTPLSPDTAPDEPTGTLKKGLHAGRGPAPTEPPPSSDSVEGWCDNSQHNHIHWHRPSCINFAYVAPIPDEPTTPTSKKEQ